MARTAINTDDTKVDQRPNINIDDALENGRPPEIIPAGERVLGDTEWLDELKFNDEWVSIRLEPNTDKNAATNMYCSVNGKGCEVMMADGTVMEMPYLPVGLELTIKRKYLAVLVNAKIDTIDTDVGEPGATEYVRNAEKRRTSAVHSVSVLEDRNPAGHAWLSALRRKNM